MEVIVSAVKIIVYIYDIITLPVYIVLQRPWINYRKANEVRAKQINPDNPYSPWVSLGNARKHPIDECLTINEAIKKSIDYNGRDNYCLGYREVIRQEIEYSKGKPLTKYVLSDYKWITYGQFDERIDVIGKGMLLNGVKPKDRVMFFADTSIDWFTCAQSILRIGATICTMYSSVNDEGLTHGLNETEVTHVITSLQLLPKLVRLKDKIPKMSTIIYFNTNNNTKEELMEISDGVSNLNLITLSDLEEMANLSSEYQPLDYQNPKEDDIAVLLYTSGSTGVPKGVELSHKNLLNTFSSFKMIIEQIENRATNRVYIAYLPLAHIFEFAIEHFFFMRGLKIGYSSPLTLTDSGSAIRKGDKGDSTLLKPSVMIGVPLILDRIRKGIEDNINKKGLIATKLFKFLIEYKSFWTQKGFDTSILNRIFCKKFRQIVGGEMCVIISGGAALSLDTHKIVKSCLNTKLIEVYAASETAGNATFIDLFDESIGRVGAPLLNTQIQLINWEEGGYRVTDKPNPRGEIVIGNESVSNGYFKLKTETEEAFYTDSEGQRWFLTGDIGEVFPNGTFKIIDRKKDLIKLKFGEYVSLGKIESELKSNEFVDNICVFGHLYDSYLVALIIPNQLSVVRLAKSLEVDYNSIYDLYENQRIIHYITNQIQRHGKSAHLSKYEIPQKIMLCSEEWTPDNGLLTASMKIKRKNITDKYQKQIDLLYENDYNSE